MRTYRHGLMLVSWLALVLAGCGGHGSSGADSHAEKGHSSPKTAAADGAPVDRAFATAMVPHHESAIEMAEVARRRGESTFVKQLAEDIVSTQAEEIVVLRRIDSKLGDQGVEAGDLGVPSHMMGMHGEASDLKDADPFDVAFVDMMIPHHEGAIEMAQAQLTRGTDPELKQLARDIIAAQAREIRAMQAFRDQAAR